MLVVSFNPGYQHGLKELKPSTRQRFVPPPAHAAALEGSEARLAVLASLMAGRTMTVEARPASEQPALRGDVLLLPLHLSGDPAPEENAATYVALALLAGAMRRLRGGVPAAAAARAAEARRLSAAARAWLASELADLRPEAAARLARLEVALLAHPDPEDQGSAGAEAGASGREARAPRLGDLRRRLLTQDPDGENPIIHTFEKVETLEAHAGGRRLADGADELDEHAEALEEVELRELVRGGPEAQAILRAELDLAASIPDVESVAPGERGLSYDEWDQRLRAYRRGWCTVYPSPVPATAPELGAALARAHRREIEALYRRVDAHTARLRSTRGQRDGEDIDVDAVVLAAADRAAGREGSERLYLRRQPRSRDVAVAVLLDVSLSTDSWVAERRVLDVARAATVVFGEVVTRLGDDLAVLAFASKTRNVCRVFEVKGFEEPWSVGRRRLGALEPQGYTRIGPALRHAAALLARQTADERLLLLISDGKPTDYDRYEGRHGEADVRMAVREAQRRGVVTHALTIDRAARGHLPATFGPGAWHVLSDPAHLPRAMAEVYRRLSAR
jgi:nitric oxide reductase activation protein